MTDTAAILAELMSATAPAEGVQRLRVCETSPLNVFIGLIRPQDMPVLQLELPGESAVPARAFRSKGLKIEAELVGKGNSAGLRYTLSLSDPGSQHLFVVVANDLLGVVSDSSSATAALTGFLARLRHWSDFFSRQQDGNLSVEEQQGLFGELWTLREMLAPYGARDAVSAWTGPFGANQDFQWRNRALETKTTAAGPSLAIRISNVKQLDDEAMERISVVLVELDRVQNGGTTLPKMVDATRGTIAEQDPEAEIEFLKRLAQTGYVLSHEGDYALTGYSVRRSRVYGVDDGFPRLQVRDLPEGVGTVTYQVDVSAMSSFEMPADIEIGSFFRRATDDTVD